MYIFLFFIIINFRYATAFSVAFASLITNDMPTMPYRNQCAILSVSFLRLLPQTSQLA